MTDYLRLHPESVERIAVRVAELLASSGITGIEPTMRAEDLAPFLRVERAWIYEHASELGAIRLGDGARPRLRFDRAAVLRRLSARSASERSPETQPPANTRKRSRRQRTSTGRNTALLPVRGFVTVQQTHRGAARGERAVLPQPEEDPHADG